MAYTEATFQSSIPRSVREHCKKYNIKHSWYHKWTDFGGWQPWDANLTISGKAIAFEYKISKLKTKINFPMMFKERYHQIEQLRKWIKSGYPNSRGYIIVNWYIKRKVNRAFLCGPETADKYIQKGTVPIGEFINDKGVRELKRLKDDLRQDYWEL